MKFISIALFWLAKGLTLVETTTSSALFVSHRPASTVLSTCARTKTTPYSSSVLYQNRRKNEFEPPPPEEEDSPVLVQAVENIAKVVSAPTPGVPTVALGFPVALLLVAVTQSFSTTITTVLLFCSLAWFGRSVALDEDKDNAPPSPSSSFVLLDGIAFLTALGAANLFVPSLGTNSNIDLGVLVGVSVAVLAIAQVIRDPIPKDSPQERLMDQWDDQFRNKKINGQQKKKNSKQKEEKDDAKGKKK